MICVGCEHYVYCKKCKSSRLDYIEQCASQEKQVRNSSCCFGPTFCSPHQRTHKDRVRSQCAKCKGKGKKPSNGRIAVPPPAHHAQQHRLLGSQELYWQYDRQYDQRRSRSSRIPRKPVANTHHRNIPIQSGEVSPLRPDERGPLSPSAVSMLSDDYSTL
jgi:hypothetical protein